MRKLIAFGLLPFVLVAGGCDNSSPTTKGITMEPVKTEPMLPNDGEWHKFGDDEYRRASNHDQYPRLFEKHYNDDGGYSLVKAKI